MATVAGPKHKAPAWALRYAEEEHISRVSKANVETVSNVSKAHAAEISFQKRFKDSVPETAVWKSQEVQEYTTTDLLMSAAGLPKTACNWKNIRVYDLYMIYVWGEV